MVKNSAFISFLITFLLGLTGIFIFPSLTINPGELIKEHSAIRNDCLACHSLGKGISTEKCTGCHQPSFIGLKSVDGKPLNMTNRKNNFLHNSIVKIQCVDCHTDHKGLSAQNATLIFKHRLLSVELQKECTKCHLPQKPEDEIHLLLINECSECHSTSVWKPSHFKHELPGNGNENCRSCHENKKPSNDLHKQIGEVIQCVHCHTTNAWIPSTFNHNKFFVFDRDHPENCANCHEVSKSFESYTCYNCHEHNPARIEREHLKEGIRNFKNCVECHRSGEKERKDLKKSRKRGKQEN